MKYETLDNWYKDCYEAMNNLNELDKENCREFTKNSYKGREDSVTFEQTKRIDEMDKFYFSWTKDLGFFLDKTPISIKEKLIQIINTYELHNFTHIKHMNIIRLTLYYYLSIKELYEANIPYDETKHMEKMQTAHKKALKNKQSILYPAPVKNYLQKFINQSIEILENFDFYHKYNHKRELEKLRNTIIDELVEVIVSDNYAKDKKYHSDMRISKKAKEFFTLECELIPERAEAMLKGKIFYKKIQSNKK